MQFSRRHFLGTMAAGALAHRAAFGAAAKSTKLELGIDNFGVRAMGWKAHDLIDYANKLAVDSLFITDLDALEDFGEDYLARVRGHAAEQGINLYLGTWSICPTSTSFKKKWGTADEHLRLSIRLANAVGSPVIRVILGSRRDRLTAGGIQARIADTVKVLKANRSYSQDHDVKIAMENHAGDMHSLELKQLIEEAGPDFVGVNLDSGNAVWTLEDPLANLENLGPYTLTTSLRDTVVWPSANGYTAQWTAMGDGAVNWEVFFRRFTELCPNAPVHIETISGFNHELKTNSDDFWKAWPAGKPQGYSLFEAFAANGKEQSTHEHPEGGDRQQAERDYQRAEIERSILYCKKIGLGRK